MKAKTKALITCAGVILTLAAAGWAGQQEGAPCCSIAGIDGRIITVKSNSGGFTFLITLADPKAASSLRVGTPVSINQADSQLMVHGRGSATQNLGLAQLRFGGFAPQGETGAAGSAASSAGSGEGTSKRTPKSGGRCPWIVETSTEQCVRTHTGDSYCEYYCVPIKKRPR